MAFLAPITLVLLILASPALADDITGKPRIIDGGTLDIAGTWIRLGGIDAPAADALCPRADGKTYRCGDLAFFALAEIIETHWITCRGDGQTPDGARTMTCFAGPYDIAAKMVDRGWARATGGRYEKEQHNAQESRRGLWADH